MAITLKEATLNSERGYIDNPGDIAEIMSHLTKITVDDFVRNTKQCFLGDFCQDLELRHIPTELMGSCNLSELMWLADNTWYSRKLKVAKERRNYYLAVVKHALLNSKASIGWVRLFMAITVKAYLDYHESIKSTYDKYTNFNKILVSSSNHLGREINEKTTIEELIKMIEKRQATQWVPWKSKKDYIKDIRATYDMLDILFIGTIKKYEDFTDKRLTLSATKIKEQERMSFEEKTEKENGKESV